jgi:4'-phosphopantetheinyl transferase
VERVCYAVDLDQDARVVEELWPLLDAREHTHAAARRDDARRRYVVAHGELRRILASHTGTAPRAIAYAYLCGVCGSHEHGRPSLATIAGSNDAAPSFSLSHSGDVAVVAIAPEPVGVDVERVRPRRYLDAVARRVLRDDEFARWAARPEADRLDAFLRVWTAKEAYLKLLGVGITRALREVDVHDTQTWSAWPDGCVTSVAGEGAVTRAPWVGVP